jgi:parallel beta-helix repeat protein
MFYSASSMVKNNKIHNLSDSYFACGIWIQGTSGNTVTCNTFNDITGVALRTWGSTSISNNHIYNVTKPSGNQYSWGIWFDYGSNGKTENNYIHQCGIGIVVGDPPTSSGMPAITPTIVNNVISDNDIGIKYIESVSGVISNNIISNNGSGIQDLVAPTANAVTYNLFWNNALNFNNVSLTGIGVITTTNTAGYPTDSYYNLFQDPMLLTASPFYGTTSPCIDSGKLLYSTYIGASQVSFCSEMILGLKDNPSSKPTASTIFPNPFSSALNVSNTSEHRITQLLLHDLAGRTTQLQFNGEENSLVTLETSDIAKGIYILEIKRQGANTEFAKIIKD